MYRTWARARFPNTIESAQACAGMEREKQWKGGAGVKSPSVRYFSGDSEQEVATFLFDAVDLIDASD